MFIVEMIKKLSLKDVGCERGWIRREVNDRDATASIKKQRIYQ